MGGMMCVRVFLGVFCFVFCFIYLYGCWIGLCRVLGWECGGAFQGSVGEIGGG